MKKSLLNLIALVVFCFGATAQNVDIPDANFKACLLAYPNINTNGDSEIQVSEANAFAGGFNCVNQNISDLTGIEAFTSMIILDCSNNNLSSLNISQNTALKRLFCANNNLSNLDVTQNYSLEYIICGDNNLNSLNISQNTNLFNFQCQNNNLNSIDVSPHWNLTNFRCQGNNLTSLDVSNNTQLQDFQCQNNQLTSLNIKNVNWSVFWVNATSNSNLTCIEVSDVATATAASTNIDPQTSFSTNCSSIVNIPDANFKTYLVENTDINTNMDAEIQVSEATAFTGTISCTNMSISDLTGIEAFVSLTKLNCSFNTLTSLNVSQNTALTELYLSTNNVSILDVSQNTALTILQLQNNNISNLDVSQNTSLSKFYCNQNNLSTLYVNQNTALTELYCQVNNLINLDVSQNIALTKLYCGANNLTNLELSQNTALTRLYCQTNNLTNLELSQNTTLDYLDCQENSITTLDISQNVALTRLECSSNNLTNLELSQNTALTRLACRDNNLNNLDVSQNIALTRLECQLNNLTNLELSQNTALEELTCQENSITTLDISQNTTLEEFSCTSNQLTVLNMKNISTNQLTDFEANSNPNLTCIEVDDVAVATAAWTNIDPQTSFSEDCGYIIPVTSISVQGQGGASTISTLSGTLQMEADVLPMNATDASYTWSVIDGTGSATIDQSGLLTAMTDGTVTVNATANDGSGVMGIADITISNQSSSTIEQSIIHSLSIYPNPANAQVIVNANSTIEAITIMEIMGRKVKTIVNPDDAINVSDLSKGIYFLQIKIGETLISKKMIKE